MSDEQQSDFLDEQEKARMVGHMNEDHADAVMNYLRVFAGVSNADTALLTDLDRYSMTLAYELDGQQRQCTIEFGSPLADKSQVRETLVHMAQEARERLQPGDG